MYGEEPKPQRGAFRIKCSDAVYINTLKKSLAKIHALGVNTDLCYEQKDGYLEVVIRIEK